MNIKFSKRKPNHLLIEAVIKNDILWHLDSYHQKEFRMDDIELKAKEMNIQIRDLVDYLNDMFEDDHLKRIVKTKLEIDELPDSNEISRKISEVDDVRIVGYVLNHRGSLFFDSGGYVKKYKSERRERRWNRINSRASTLGIIIPLIISGIVTSVVVLNATLGWFGKLMEVIVKLPN